MKTQIDLKSTLGGLAIGILAMFAIGAGTRTFQNETNRYQIAVAANVALVIDTQTGQVWTKCWQSFGDFTADPDFAKPKLVESQ